MFSSFVLEGADSTTFNRLFLACLIGMGMPIPVHAQQQISFWGGYVPPYLAAPVPRYPLPYGYMPPPPYAYPYYSPTQPYPYPYYLPYPPPNTGEPHFDVSKVIPAGRLFIKIQPEDADVMVDGFQLKPLADNTYEIGLLVGPHKVEARKQNYGNYSGVVEVRRNEGLLVTISLQKLK